MMLQNSKNQAKVIIVIKLFKYNYIIIYFKLSVVTASRLWNSLKLLSYQRQS